MNKKLLATLAALLFTLPALADVLIFGGTRGVGLETVRQLREKGEGVTVMVRETSDLAKLNEIDGVTLVVGDAMEMDTVTAAYASGEFDAAVSTLSGNPAVGYAVDSVGSIHAIDGAIAAGVKHFVLVSSIGVGDSADALPPPVLKVLGEALAGKLEAENYLVASGLAYTIIRPGVLTNKPANGNGILTEDVSAMGVVSRAEIARLTIESIGNEEANGRTYSAVEEKK